MTKSKYPEPAAKAAARVYIINKNKEKRLYISLL